MGSQRVIHDWATFTFTSGDPSGKELTCQCRRFKRHSFNSWVGKIPWRRAWQPTPIFLPGESAGQGSLLGYIHAFTGTDTAEAAYHTAHTSYLQYLCAHLYCLGPKHSIEGFSYLWQLYCSHMIVHSHFLISLVFICISPSHVLNLLKSPYNLNVYKRGWYRLGTQELSVCWMSQWILLNLMKMLW